MKFIFYTLGALVALSVLTERHPGVMGSIRDNVRQEIATRGPVGICPPLDPLGVKSPRCTINYAALEASPGATEADPLDLFANE